MKFIVIAVMAFNGFVQSAAAATIIPAERLAESAVVRDISAENGVVSGIVVNNSGRLLENVKILIRYGWLWEDEFSPGHDSPGRAVLYTLPNRILPGEQAPFIYYPESPLPNRSDGRFVTSAAVVGVTQFD